MNTITNIFVKLVTIMLIIIDLITKFFQQITNNKVKYEIKIIDLEIKDDEDEIIGNPCRYLI